MAQASFHDIIHAEQPVLIDFSAEWCGPCKALAPILKEVAAKVKDDVRVLKVDVDRNPNISMEFQIQGVPTLILFHRGKVLWRQSGVVPAAYLLRVLNEQLSTLQQ